MQPSFYVIIKLYSASAGEGVRKVSSIKSLFMSLACFKLLGKMFVTSFPITRRKQLIGSINKLSAGMGTNFCRSSFTSNTEGGKQDTNPSLKGRTATNQGQCYCHYFQRHLLGAFWDMVSS